MIAALLALLVFNAVITAVVTWYLNSAWTIAAMRRAGWEGWFIANGIFALVALITFLLTR